MKTLNTKNGGYIKVLESQDVNNISTIVKLFGNKIKNYITYLFVVADWDDMEDVANIAAYAKYEENWTSDDFETEFHSDYYEWYDNDFDLTNEIERITKNLEYFNSHKTALIKQYNKALKEYGDDYKKVWKEFAKNL